MADHGEGETCEEGTRPETLRNTTLNEMGAWICMSVLMEVHDTKNARHFLKREKY